MSDPGNTQRSEEGDARRKVHVEADRVFNGPEKDLLIRIRESKDGRYYVHPYGLIAGAGDNGRST